jgi:hypothetical protein
MVVAKTTRVATLVGWDHLSVAIAALLFSLTASSVPIVEGARQTAVSRPSCSPASPDQECAMEDRRITQRNHVFTERFFDLFYEYPPGLTVTLSNRAHNKKIGHLSPCR